jgi:hypothetical protein
MCFTNATKNATVTVAGYDECEWVYESSDTVPAVTILDAELGLVYVDTKLLSCTSCNILLVDCNDKYPQYLDIWYKTNPQVMRKPFQITAIRDAIAYYTAAELPVTACACTITEGFIFQAQTSFARKTLNPFTGETITNMEYRDMYGRVRYQEIMCKVPSYNDYGRL